uniref:Thaumatin-like protein n=1 Tax=Leersia perrieri TaxID=77586 RepID=A0A0D9VRL3_9ORYZ
MEAGGRTPALLLLVGAIWLQLHLCSDAAGTTVFTLRNNCTYTVWPASLSGNTAVAVGGGGFELSPGANVSFPAPAGWSGRFWARTDCIAAAAASSGAGSVACATGDCGGAVSCSLGGAPPVTLAEFTLGGADGKDFYDVSLVDGYNVGIGVTATGAAVNHSTCGYAGCVGDVNALCPAELQVTGTTTAAAANATVACRSACEAFGTAEYCCTREHGGPDSCGPTRYSRMFKAACPAAYSYAYDDPTSTFTCGAGAQYLITFCPVQQQ